MSDTFPPVVQQAVTAILNKRSIGIDDLPDSLNLMKRLEVDLFLPYLHDETALPKIILYVDVEIGFALGDHPRDVLGLIYQVPERTRYRDRWLGYLLQSLTPPPEYDALADIARRTFGLNAQTYKEELALAQCVLEHPEAFASVRALVADALARQTARLAPYVGAEVKPIIQPAARLLARAYGDLRGQRDLRQGLERYLLFCLRQCGFPPAVARDLLDEAGLGAGAPEEDPAAREQRIAELQEQAAPILYAAHPLDEISLELKRLGWGGDVNPLKLLYLATVSRVLPKRRGTLPCHTQVNGPPGSGKSFAVDCVAALLPPEAYEVYDAGSPRVMVYDPVSYKHKVVVYREADSIPGVARGDEDNPAASMIRTLLQDGEAHYKVPIKDKETGAWTIQEVVKEGPSVLITTTVDRTKGEQLDSRLFALDIPDDPRQQRAALAAQADAEEHGTYPEPSPMLIAFQQFLQLSAPVPVVVPYVRALNDLLGKSRIDARLLRDAARMLSLIKAASIVHQMKRDRDADSRVIASYEDYQVVADLLADQYENTVTGASAKVREVVQAVGQFQTLSVSRLAQVLGISQPAATKRVKAAEKGGWVVNTEDRKGHPARLVVGDPLPHRCGLPSVEQLKTWRPTRTPVRDVE